MTADGADAPVEALPSVPSGRGALDADQVWALLQPLDGRRVGSDDKGHAHLTAWDVRRHLIRYFGWGGFDVETVSLDLVHESNRQNPNRADRLQWTVVYRALVRLTIRDRSGRIVTVLEDGATGDASNLPTVGDAHDMAMKTALSQALKRCAVNLGDGFGMSLYAGGLDPVVVRSMGHPGIEIPRRPSGVEVPALNEADVEVQPGDDDRHAPDRTAPDEAADAPQAPAPDAGAALAQQLADAAATARTLDELRDVWARTGRANLAHAMVRCDDGTGPSTEGELQGWIGYRRGVIEGTLPGTDPGASA